MVKFQEKEERRRNKKKKADTVERATEQKEPEMFLKYLPASFIVAVISS